jgi:hypothetical protein
MNMDTRAASGILALVIAVLVHLVVLQVPIRMMGTQNAIPESDDKTVEIVSLDKPIVMTSRTLVQESEGVVRFLGETRNRTSRETRARLRGRFSEGAGHSIGEDALGIFHVSRSPNALPDDIAHGDETVLNTDRYRFASFTNRIADEIYQPWVDSVRMAHENLVRAGHEPSASFYLTRLGVTLDADGQVVAIKLLKGCGIDEFDEAPRSAFWEIGQFSNPPAALLAEDGWVQFVYEFHLELKGSIFRIFSGTV